MSTLQIALSAFAGISAAFFVAIASITNNAKAIGISVIPAILLSWQCLLLTVFFFVLFCAASRIGNKVLKGFLFWIPVTAISVFGLSYVAFISYVLLRFRHG